MKNGNGVFFLVSGGVLSCRCRIYPNWDLKFLFWDNFGACRFVHNKIREKVKNARRHNNYLLKHNDNPEFKDEKPVMLNRSFYNTCLTRLKHDNPFLYELDSTSLQDSYERLKRAFDRYDKKIAAFPKLKTLKNPVQSFTLKNVNNSIRIKDGYLRLNKYGFVKIHGNRDIPGKIKTVTIKFDKGRWYAIITYSIKGQLDMPLPKTGKMVGIDSGLKNYIMLSSGEVIAKPDTRELDEKIKKQKRIVSRRYQVPYHGTNYTRAIEKLWQLENKRQDTLNDFYHKISKKIVTQYDIIVMETLNIHGMLKNRRVSAGVHDASWYRLKMMIKYKAQKYGKTFIEIDQWFASTKTCQYCGYKNKKLTLKDRKWTCPNCGKKHERDHNAAVNILNEGLRMLKIK